MIGQKGNGIFFNLQTEPDMPATIRGYRVAGVIHKGNWSTVYLGERLEDFEKRVAIKSFLSRRVKPRESSTLVSLHHPAIVRFLDRGSLDDNFAYVVMEFVDGEPIDKYAASHDLSLHQRMAHILTVAEAVEYGHARLVLHGDLRACNIFVTASGEVKLLNFGFASIFADDAGFEMEDSALTFVRPEQRDGQTLTIASDIYSLGAMGQSLAGKIDSPSLRAIFNKACAAEPDQRYKTMREFAGDLRAFLTGHSVGAYRKGKLYAAERWVQRNRITALLLMSLVVAFVLSASVVTVETARASHRRHIAQARLRELAALTGKLQGELYASLPAGETSTEARRQLLAKTTATLAQLSADDERDPALRKELARQYVHLAELQRHEGDIAAAKVSLQAANVLAQAKSP